MAQMLAGRPDFTTWDTSVLGMDHFGATLISYLSFVVPSERPSRTVGSGSTVHCPENSCRIHRDTQNCQQEGCMHVSRGSSPYNPHPGCNYPDLPKCQLGFRMQVLEAVTNTTCSPQVVASLFKRSPDLYSGMKAVPQILIANNEHETEDQGRPKQQAPSDSGSQSWQSAAPGGP